MYITCNTAGPKSDEIQWIIRYNFLSVGLECPLWKQTVLHSCALQSTPRVLCSSVTSYLLFYSNFSSPSLCFPLFCELPVFWVFAFFLYTLNYLLHSGPHKCSLLICVCVTRYSQGRVKLVAVQSGHTVCSNTGPNLNSAAGNIPRLHAKAFWGL